MEQKKFDVNEYKKKCQEILDDVEIRFAGLLDENGSVLAGGSKPGMDIRLSAEQLNSVCKELASRVAKRKKLDTELGHVKYSASRREHVVIMSFPIFEKVVMVVAESNVNIDRLAFRIIGKLGRQWGEFVGE
jgi:3-methyladenine DNA glycosylase/8-oxoguanine DNA glycosylase